MKNTKRLLAIILSLVLICTALPLSFAGFAQTGNGYAFAEELGAELGKNLYDHNFSELSEVPSDWSVVSGSAAMGTSEQGGITKSGYSISGANGSMNTVRIKVPAKNFVVKLSMYQVTSYWGGDGGRVYIYKHGTNTGNEQYFEAAQIQLGGYKRTSWLPPVNGAAIYKYDADGNTSNDTATRLEDIGGGFGTDGHSLNTLYIYSYEGTTYYVNEAGTLLGSSVDAKEFENNYITIAGDYMRILLSDFEAYELKKPSSLKGGYVYTEELGATLGKNLYDHNFSELSAVPSDWSVVNGSAAMGEIEQGGITKKGYSISGANENRNTVRIKIPAKNFVAKFSLYQVTEYWGGDGGCAYIYKHGKNIGDTEYLPLSEIRLAGYNRPHWLPPANGAAIYKYDSDGNTSNDTATRLEDIGGGFGVDGHSLLTVYVYSYAGNTYYVNEAGTLLGSTKDSNTFEETYITLEGSYMRVLFTDFEVYELDSENAELPYTNLVLNGDFKEDTSNWIPCTSGVTLSYNEEGYATATVKKKGWCELYSNVFEVKENYDLVFEFDYKTAIDYDSDVFTVYLFLYTAESMEGKNKETLGANGSIPSGYKSANLMLIPKTSWQNGKIEYTVPEGYTYGQVRFAFRGSVPVGDSFSVDNVSVYRLVDVFDRINEAINEENVNAFKELIKEKSAGIIYELITVDEALMSALKAKRDEKGEDLTANDIYTVSINKVTNIGSRLELFAEDSLIDLNNTTASFVTMSPKFEEQTLDLSGGFRCEDANNDKYNGSFDATNLTEDTRPWEHLGGDYCEVVKDGDIYRMYYRGADDGILTANAYTLYGGDDPLASYMNICYAESKDGINWYRPELGIHEFIMDGENIPNNIMLGDIKENFDGSRVSSFSVAIDTSEDCPADERYKGLLANVKAQGWGYSVYALKSADGIHWEKMNNGVPVINDKVGESFDSHNVVIYNETTDEFVLYFRRWATDVEYGRQRIVSVLTSKDFVTWGEVDSAKNLDYYSNETNENLVIKNENYDGEHPDNYQLYTNGVFVYDRAPHLTLGMPTRYLGDSTGHEVAPYFIASRDGINFKFWDDKLIENSAELDRDGNRSNYSLTGIVRTSETEYSMFASRGFKDSVCIFDRFSFRVDGFVAAVGDASGKILTTTPVTFDGNSLILNYKAPNGTVRAQLTDVNGNVLEGFSFNDCKALTGDSIEQELKFKGNLSTINQPVKISFELINAELYSYKFEKQVVKFGGASILTAEVEQQAGHQAIRFFASYEETEDIVERGLLIYKETDKELTVDFEGVVKTSKTSNFNSCWQNKDGIITYSTYIKGFKINDTRALTVRGYVKTIDGVIHYTEQKTYSVEYIKRYNELTNNTYYFSDENVLEKVKIQGAYRKLDDGITFDWTANTAVVKAYCTGTVEFKLRIPKDVDKQSYTVYIDGQRLEKVFEPKLSDSAKNEYTVSVDISGIGVHTIEFIRRSEAANGTSDLLSVTMKGTLEKVEENELLIEFIGDSITCGTGNLNKDDTSAKYNDGSQTYAFFTAKKLGADYRMRSKSGAGFEYSSGGSHGDEYSWDLMYPLQNTFRDKETAYVNNREADIVCIYLGTNDYWSGWQSATGKWMTGDADNAVAQMKEVIALVKQHNPNAKVVWINGGMTTSYQTISERTMAELGGAENGYYTVLLPNGNSGGAGHPTVAEHTQMGEALYSFLIENDLV